MMATLPPADRVKLARVLALLSSPHAGERDAAGLAAHRLVSSRGLTWVDVLGGDAPALRPAEPQPAGRPATPRSFAEDARACLRQAGLFSPWEVSFLSSIVVRRRLSPKQAAILADLVDRLQDARGYAG